MAKDEFLKKVYDRYLNTDYEYGVSNLNPKREITPVEVKDTRTEEEQILDLVKARFEKIKEETNSLLKYNLPKKEKTDQFEAELPSPGNSPGRPHETTGVLPKNAGRFFIPGITPDNDTDPLLKDIEQKILELTPYLHLTGDGEPTLPGGKTPTGGEHETSSKVDKTPFEDVGMFQMNCAGMSFNDLLGADAADKKASDDDTSDDGSGNNDGDQGGEEGDSGDDSGDDGSSMDSGADDNDLETAEERAAREQAEHIAACAKMNLEFLTVILIILKVVFTMRDVVSVIMAILVPLMKTIARASTCWVAPPNAAEVVQLLAEKASAIGISILGKLLSELLKMLDAQCITAGTVSILNQIMEVLAQASSLPNVVTSVAYSCSSASATIKSEVEKIKGLDDKAKELLEDYKKQIEDGWNSSAMKELFTNPKDFFNDVGDSIKSNAGGVAKKVIAKTPIAGDVESAAEMTKAIVEKTKKIYEDTKTSLNKLQKDSNKAEASMNKAAAEGKGALSIASSAVSESGGSIESAK